MPTWKPPTAPTMPVRQAIAEWLRSHLDDSVVSDQSTPARVKRAIMKVPAAAVNKLLPMQGWTETPEDLGVADIPAPGAMTLYHGSPFKFTKFMRGKIGKGAGSQSEGFGHYLTNARDLAKEYAENLLEWEGWKVKSTPGNVYTVDVPDDIVDTMLDYKAPLGAQPAITEKLQAIGLPATADTTGREFYEKLWRQMTEGVINERVVSPQKRAELLEMLYDRTPYLLNDPELFPVALQKRGNVAAMQRLNAAGIPGNRYPDVIGRTKAPAENFVVGPAYEKALKIVSRRPYVKPK